MDDLLYRQVFFQAQPISQRPDEALGAFFFRGKTKAEIFGRRGSVICPSIFSILRRWFKG